MKRALSLVGAALAAACASVPAPPERALEARVSAVLERRGLGSDALGVIDNMLGHDAPLPPHVPALARELLARPLAALDAAAAFERSVPAELRRLAGALEERPGAGPPLAARELLEPYLRDLAEAQALLRAAWRSPIEPQGILRELDSRLPTAAQLGALAGALDEEALGRAIARFLGATARFARTLRAVQGRMHFPEKAERFESAIGTVVIGSAGDDRHAPAALILDPGGNDTYERAVVSGGAIAVIVDLAGDDSYVGADLAVGGFSALLDLAGADRYLAEGPGIGAAVAGVSVLVDASGDDVYEAAHFGLGAAAFGIGALIDLAGDDAYRVRAGGQGFGMTGGLGLLWDRAGADQYFAAGVADAFDRGGGVSMAQGVGLGGRSSLGGGIGILRDDAGDDRYEAEMFAQGAAYFFGAGLLWDRGGDDRYHAVRYAQGCGVHQAVGLLRDESGSDRYALAVGVGQGMGLDQSVGALYDGAGDDEYVAPAIAQGAATANGVGILADLEGANRWRVGPDRLGWGHAQWARDLPSIGLLLYEPRAAVFERSGIPERTSAEHAALGGPSAGTRAVHEAETTLPCPAGGAAPGEPGPPLAEALQKLLPSLIAGRGDPRLYAAVRARLLADLGASLAELPVGPFNVSYALGESLRCALRGASEAEARGVWDEIERQLAAAPPSPFAGALLVALRGRPAPPAQMRRILRALDASPRCAVRVLALSLRDAALPDAAVDARAALRSPCWREQAAALALLQRLGAVPEPGAPLPSFLRAQQAAIQSLKSAPTWSSQ